MTRISVCMASYNGEQFIERQLHSILSQLSKDDEVVISDDASTDNTLNIIHSLSDSRIKIIFNKGKPGPVGNFENALLHSSGQLIFLADQDDIWLPGKVAISCSLLEQNDLILSNCEVVDHLGNVLQSSFFENRKSKKGFLLNLYRNSYIGCCMAFRRDVLTYALPFPDRIHMHDWWIGLLVEAKGKVLFYDKPLIKYVRHGGNASPTGEIGYGFLQQLENRFFLFLNVVIRLLH